MCTALYRRGGGGFFGRTLDYEISFGEEVVLAPRRFLFPKRETTAGLFEEEGYAVRGMAHVAEGFPLYYDAVNEKGLAMAGLNFVGNAVYLPPVAGKRNVPVFAFIPYILRSCASIGEARALLQEIHLTGAAFSPALPTASLHFMLASAEGALTVEPTAEGLAVYENHVGVLTNNPPFPEQLAALRALAHLSPGTRAETPLKGRYYSRGSGTVGLPGDLSSASRFARAAFTGKFALEGEDRTACIGQFFHVLGTVEQVKGCCLAENERYEYTIYTSCMSLASGEYYFTTYGNRRIRLVKPDREAEAGNTLVCRPLGDREDILALV